MKRLVHGRIVTGVIGDQAVFLKAFANVIGLGGKGHVNTPAQIAEHRAAIALKRRNHFHLTAMMQLAAIGLRLQHLRQIVHTARWKLQAARRRRESGGIGHGGHLDGALGTVQEGVKHLRVEISALHGFLGEPVMAPHAIGCRCMVRRQVLGALAGGDDFKSRRARPVDHFANQCRLVTVGQRIDDARFGRAPRQQRPGQRIGLDIDHDDMLAVLATRQYMGNARRRIAGGIDDDFEVPVADQRLGIVGNVRGAADERLLEVVRRELFVLPAHPPQRLPGTFRIEVGDTQQMNSRRARNLR